MRLTFGGLALKKQADHDQLKGGRRRFNVKKNPPVNLDLLSYSLRDKAVFCRIALTVLSEYVLCVLSQFKVVSFRLSPDLVVTLSTLSITENTQFLVSIIEFLVSIIE